MTNPTDTTLWAQPRAGTIRDHYGDPCSAAQRQDYPLSAKCVHCGQPIRLLDGTADWFHGYTKRGPCDIEGGEL